MTSRAWRSFFSTNRGLKLPIMNKCKYIFMLTKMHLTRQKYQHFVRGMHWWPTVDSAQKGPGMWRWYWTHEHIGSLVEWQYLIRYANISCRTLWLITRLVVWVTSRSEPLFTTQGCGLKNPAMAYINKLINLHTVPDTTVPSCQWRHTMLNLRRVKYSSQAECRAYPLEIWVK